MTIPRHLLRLVTCALSLSAVSAASAADLTWEVENPFRFYRNAAAFKLHEQAYTRVRGASEDIPADIVARTERAMNAPDCRDPSTAATCAATIRNEARFQASRLGWAAKTLDAACYDRESRPRRYPAHCSRTTFRRAVREDYVLPASHAVTIGLSAERVKTVGEGSCTWTWTPRNAPAQSKSMPCGQKLTIERVPYSKDKAGSGVSVDVQLPDGTKLTEDVVVEDLLIVALGDSFASGESNPDRPVTFGNREISYEPQREDTQRPDTIFRPGARIPEVAKPGTYNPRVLPRRLMEDEERGEQLGRTTPEFLAAFNKRGARWLSPDCHRSQYGYPFRVAMQLTLEDRRRAVTLVHLACSGAQVTEGLFVPKEAREDFAKPGGAMVPAQFDQLTDLLCRDGAAQRRGVAYTMPFFKYGQQPALRTITKQWCPPEQRKRPIDLVLLSIGGNDVGFSPLAAYAMTESAGALAPIAGLLGSEIRFGPDLANRYVGSLDERMVAVKSALRDGFGITPDRVIQTAYEPIQYDENGGLCGAEPTLGMDVHPALKLGGERLREAAQFFDGFVKRLSCIANAGAGCPTLATGRGTGFTLVTEHHAKFSRRGLCARNPRMAAADGAAMSLPRFNALKGEFQPYHPAHFTPYGPHWRLFRTPNDAFLTGNTHHEKIPLYDILQPVYAALYSGAIHPTAEGHAIVADAVVLHARRKLMREGAVSMGMPQPVPASAPVSEPQPPSPASQTPSAGPAGNTLPSAAEIERLLSKPAAP